MTRKPIAIEVAMPSDPGHYWRKMRARANGFTLSDIALSSEGVAYTSVKRYARFLVKSGFVVRIGEKKSGYATEALYAVKKDSRVAPIERADPLARPPTAREALWTAMRALAQFSVAELAISASTDERAVSGRSANLFVQKSHPGRRDRGYRSAEESQRAPDRSARRALSSEARRQHGAAAAENLRRQLRVRPKQKPRPRRRHRFGGQALNAPVNLNASKTDFLVNAREAFGEALPDWIEIVARESNRTSATAVAARLSYSTAVVSSLCRGNYKGDLGAVEARVRGVYMGELVECPIIGEIARDHCIEEQGKKHIGTSQIRTALFHACRSGCANSRLKTEGSAA